jgi:hypothetical protein
VVRNLTLEEARPSLLSHRRKPTVLSEPQHFLEGRPQRVLQPFTLGFLPPGSFLCSALSTQPE